jgi:hypothetical protein
MRRFLIAMLLASSLAYIAFESHAHPGGLNAEGCHHNRKTGDYHCHRATERTRREAVVRQDAEALVKKSRRGICHAPQSPWYEATRQYVSYPSLRACLASGGRLPRG